MNYVARKREYISTEIKLVMSQNLCVFLNILKNSIVRQLKKIFQTIFQLAFSKPFINYET